jgi:hypothetical protein
MTLRQRLIELINAIAVTIKSVDTKIGSLPSLPTDDKSSIVNAMIELNGKLEGAQSVFDDAHISSTKGYSSYKIETLITGINNSLSGLTLALGQIKASDIDNDLNWAPINDSSTNDTSTWSGMKIQQEINSNVEDVGANISGARNGINYTYIVSQAFVANTTKVYLNGMRQTRGSTNDYVELDNNKIVFTYPPSSGDVLLVEYKKL